MVQAVVRAQVARPLRGGESKMLQPRTLRHTLENEQGGGGGQMDVNETLLKTRERRSLHRRHRSGSFIQGLARNNDDN